MKFAQLGVPNTILASLTKMNFIVPTPIQERAIPIALNGKDILGSAQTGTGKTAAFVIPMIHHLINQKFSNALVLLPTRELAVQVLENTYKILGDTGYLKPVLLIGGESTAKQLKQLKEEPRLIIGTPGRINDHLARKSLDLSHTDFLILDETDRMLDMGFEPQLNMIIKFLPRKRQTLMFSATILPKVVILSNKYLNNPIRIAIEAKNTVIPKIKQEIVKTSDSSKYGDLMNQIQLRKGLTLIFVKTKFGANQLRLKLNKENLSVATIHGDLNQAKRIKVINDFKKQKFRILVATDIAARGLDIPLIENVINYDLPQSPIEYIHRIGRTGRAGANGIAINFLTPQNNRKWKEIDNFLSTNPDKIKKTFKGPKKLSKHQKTNPLSKTSRTKPLKLTEAKRTKNFRKKSANHLSKI